MAEESTDNFDWKTAESCAKTVLGRLLLVSEAIHDRDIAALRKAVSQVKEDLDEAVWYAERRT